MKEKVKTREKVQKPREIRGEHTSKGKTLRISSEIKFQPVQNEGNKEVLMNQLRVGC